MVMEEGDMVIVTGNAETHVMPPLTLEHLRKWWPKVKIADACWEWTGSVCGTAGQYGQIGLDRENYRAHRIFFTLFKYPIPPDKVIDHLCNNKLCVNPDHMEESTQQQNIARAKKRAYCKRGHPQVDENLYKWGNGKRRCRPCVRVCREEKRQSTLPKGDKA